MPTGTTFIPPSQARPDTSAPKKAFRLSDLQPSQIAPTQARHELEPPFLSPVPYTATTSIQSQSTADHDFDANPAVQRSGEAEDEYVISAYGDISLSDIIVPPLSAPTHSGFEPLQPIVPQPRLRLRVQRPPMPKRRPSYYVPDPMPHSGGLEPDEYWPGNPRLIADGLAWVQHQPLVSPLPVDPLNSRTEENKPVKKSGSSLEKIFDDLLPRPPSIRLSPPGSPASQALSLPQEIYEQRSGVQQGRKPLESDNAAELPQFPPAPAPPHKSKPAPWRTRLPPRLPIPKWDM
ncbi:hypothetical protein J3R82DRAFT_3125 [Butyriboletus roseoflavus]|nr:hypothetical protein J3R82DRAFT_3125 [Butyriboletus roseoflavus]